jgi:hypothetical protein
MKTIKIIIASLLIIGLGLTTSAFAFNTDNLDAKIVIKTESNNLSIEYKTAHAELLMTVLESENGIVLKKQIAADTKSNLISYSTLGQGDYIVMIEDDKGNVVKHYTFSIPE